MKFKLILFAASALALSAWPVASLAQHQDDPKQQHGGHPNGGGHPAGGGGAHPNGGGGAHPNGGGGAHPMGGGGGHPNGGGGVHPNGGGGGHPMGGGGGAHPTYHPGGGATGAGQGGGVHTMSRTTHTGGRGAGGQGAAGQGAGGQHTTIRGGSVRGGGTINNNNRVVNRTVNRNVTVQHTNVRNTWNSGHSHANVQSRAVWHSNHNWWRGNARFHGYSGPRSGFYFAPGRGYYSVPREYWGRRWGLGELLPLFFLSYAFSDYYDYGLPPPPPGCEWVWVGNNVLLVEIDDGYVVDEYYDVY